MSQRKKELIIEFEYLEKQILNASEKLSKLDSQAAQLNASIQAIQAISQKETHDSLVPIAAGVYVNAQVKETDKFIVDVGSDVAVPKTAEETISLFEVQLAATNEFQEKLVQRLESLSQRADQLQKEMVQLAKGE